MLTLEGIYDGQVVRLLSKQSLAANMPVKILVEDPFEKNEEVPVLGEDYSFLKVAMQAKLRGPKDFSENINDYLKSDLEDRIVPLSIQLSPDEEALLKAASRQCARSPNDLARQGVRELCQRLMRQADQTPYELGQDLFGAGQLAEAPTDPVKRQIWEFLHAKHRRLG